MAPLKVGIAGLGTVGAEVVRLIENEGRTLSARYGRGVRVALVENEQRIRQAARNLRRFLESGLETLHNVVPLANRR